MSDVTEAQKNPRPLSDIYPGYSPALDILQPCKLIVIRGQAVP